jgi:hypothetical protein
MVGGGVKGAGRRRSEVTSAPHETTRSPSAKTLPRALRLVVDVADPTMREAVAATGARLGVEVIVDGGGRPLRVPPMGTIAHALRVEAVCEIGARPSLGSISKRARRALAPLLRDALKEATAGATLHEDAAGRIAIAGKNLAPVDLGEPPEAEAAIREAQARVSSPVPGSEIVVAADAAERARAIVFGPSRTLSEVASRRVLEAFGVASPSWRLAEDAARAASHARAIGYPVDLRIASPDASAIDDAGLSANELRTPAEVREAFRSIAREIKRVSPTARVLGVTVASHLPSTPRVRLTLEMHEEGAAQMEVALDDPVGAKLARPLAFVPPMEGAEAAAILARFEGKNALPSGDVARGRALIETVVRVARLSLALSGTIERAEIVGLAPMTGDERWGVGGVRLRVRGVGVDAS